MAVPPFSFIFLLLLCVVSVRVSVSLEKQETFIVHVMKSEKPLVFSSHRHWYSSIISTLSNLSSSSSELLYTYDRVAHGFSARLTPSQASELRNVPGVISVLPDQILQPQTTQSPQFLGLAESNGLWPDSDFADDVIVGVIDTGIWPEHRSFSDAGLSPVPSRWKGACEVGPDFPATSCNRKLIGARAFYRGYEVFMGRAMDKSAEVLSPRDTTGHGTICTSIAAGASVPNASLLGYALGEARGMATKARIAAYKVCWSSGCSGADSLAAMDRAVADGVDVLSISLARRFAVPYVQDNIAIAAFGAVQQGVLVACGAGNAGPGRNTVDNVAPWILTVGASTIDREFPADVVLGDGRVFTGSALFFGVPLGQNRLPVVYGGDAGSALCNSGQLSPSIVRGKIVFCESLSSGDIHAVSKGFAVQQAGGAGVIIANQPNYGDQLNAHPHQFPASLVTVNDGNQIRAYIRSNPWPTATILFRGTVIGGASSPSAPRVAAFSSRGFNIITPQIPKPDLIAPGVNILGATTGAKSPVPQLPSARLEFNIESGTSMACPHVGGLAALLKKSHPDWSPSAIKSALMTTAYTVDNSGTNLVDLTTGTQSVPLFHGSGHVDPNKAMDPGLIYDLGTSDYVDFLCTIGYDSRLISLFTRDSTPVDCSTRNLGNPGALNYPSFSVFFYNFNPITYKRTVKNVGTNKNAVYQVKVSIPTGVQVSISPTRLVFSEDIDTLSYQVTFRMVNLISFAAYSGSIIWEDGVHVVRSPITISWQPSVQSSYMLIKCLQKWV
ncbi:subtilisin-like protease SBT1.4 [Ipomoea triloba]|uniref:subtilisin-like protease SBT1.4 n=1 Tax=Ipomoea triloba TaxID=35885 RepID=UPI00125E5E63|nr:subtilisin-like protease SBT1.4 [Ipomoea triloba]